MAKESNKARDRNEHNASQMCEPNKTKKKTIYRLRDFIAVNRGGRTVELGGI